MKKQFPTLPHCRIGLALLVALLLSVPVGYGLAQGTMVVVDPPSSEITVGAMTTVNIRVENVTDLYGAEVHLTFDPALLEVIDADPGTAGVQIEPGPLLSPDFTAQNAVDQAAGKIDFAIAQMPPHDPVSGSGVLAIVTFQGKAAGTSAIDFANVILSDRDGQPFSAGTQGGSITVTSEETPTATPTPGTPTPCLLYTSPSPRD